MSELEKQLAILVEKGVEVAEQTGEFVIEQAPLLLQEFYMWHISKSVFTIISVLLASYLVFKILISLGEKEIFYERYGDKATYWMGRYYGEIKLAFVIIITVVGSFFAVSLIYCSAKTILFITIAPKLYLIEYFTK